MRDRLPIYGYMLAHEGRTDEQIQCDELRLFRWAQLEGYDLAVIYQEEREGSIAVLIELLEQLRLTGDPAVVVPSIEHFGSGFVLQEHLGAHLVRCAGAALSEAGGQ